jgi:hypothetical protein
MSSIVVTVHKRRWSAVVFSVGGMQKVGRLAISMRCSGELKYGKSATVALSQGEGGDLPVV